MSKTRRAFGRRKHAAVSEAKAMRCPCGKRPYGSESEAAATARKLIADPKYVAKPGMILSVYPCRSGPKVWHLGHTTIPRR